jgi:hypothetical protein
METLSSSGVVAQQGSLTHSALGEQECEPHHVGRVRILSLNRVSLVGSVVRVSHSVTFRLLHPFHALRKLVNLTIIHIVVCSTQVHILAAQTFTRHQKIQLF